MGEKKARLQAFRNRKEVDAFAEYLVAFQYCLRLLIRTLPAGQYSRIPGFSSIGTIDLWPCSDGMVALIYDAPGLEVSLRRMDPISSTMMDFYNRSEATAMTDSLGQMPKIRPAFGFGAPSEVFLELVSPVVSFGTTVYKPKYSRALISGYKAPLPKPDLRALEDMRIAFAKLNILGEKSGELDPNSQSQELERSGKLLLEQYSALLDTAILEEELQGFLAEHPEFIFPDFQLVYPKFRLGDDYTTDFVFLIQGESGQEYVFVEIERASKRVFTGSGQFSSEFTQAKDQLLDWERWVQKNHAYVSPKLPGLFKPKFHLVMGRATDLTESLREKLRTEFHGTTRSFSTFDDLAGRFSAILGRFLGIGQSTERSSN